MENVYSLRRLIELAIGSPEPGHVNFHALQCVLNAFADRLEMADERISCSISDTALTRANSAERRMDDDLLIAQSPLPRMLAGADPADDAQEASIEEQVTGSAVPAEHHEAPAEEHSPPEPEPDHELEPAAAAAAAAESHHQHVVNETASSHAPHVAPSQSHDKSLDATQTKEHPEGEISSLKSDDDVNKTVKSAMREIRNVVVSMEQRLSALEKELSSEAHTDDFIRGVSIMKDQLDLVMGQLHVLTTVVTKHKTDEQVLEQLRVVSNELFALRNNNTFIASSNTIKKFDDDLISKIDSDKDETKDGACDNASRRSSLTPSDQPEDETNLDLEMHLTYSPDQILNQMMDLKGEVCTLTTKVNSLIASMTDHDANQNKQMINNLRYAMQELKVSISALRENQEMLAANQRHAQTGIDELQHFTKKLMEEKVNKTDMEVRLAEKADLVQLQKKVSQEQQLELQCRLEKQFCEVRKLIGNHTENIMQTIDHVRNAVGPKAIEEIVKKHKLKLQEDLNTLRDILEKYITATNDDCLAAGARIKVLQDLACLSCDTTCNMKIMERAKVPKMRDAHASNLLAPLITYELGSIRKSGIMGYYRKDEFPNSPNAWMERQTVAMKACVPRHAGGAHTISTPKDKVEKILMQKK